MKGEAMSATVLYMSMSLDGFIAGPNEGAGQRPRRRRAAPARVGPAGRRRPHEALSRRDRRQRPGRRRVHVDRRGRRRPRDVRAGGRLGRRPPRRRADLHRQPQRARHRRRAVAAGHLRRRRRRPRWPRPSEAAGEKNVLVHGAGIAQLALAAGVLDEIEIHLVPVLFGQGRRLFDDLGRRAHRAGAHPGPRGRTASPTCTTASGAERRREGRDTSGPGLRHPGRVRHS